MNFVSNATTSRGFTFLARRRRSSSHVAKSADTVVPRLPPFENREAWGRLFRGGSEDSLCTKEVRAPVHRGCFATWSPANRLRQRRIGPPLGLQGLHPGRYSFSYLCLRILRLRIAGLRNRCTAFIRR